MAKILLVAREPRASGWWTALASAGHDVAIAAGPTSPMAGSPPDAVVVEVQALGRDLGAWAVEVRRATARPDLPLVAVMARGQHPRAEPAADLDIEYVSDPEYYDEILAPVARRLRRSGRAVDPAARPSWSASLIDALAELAAEPDPQRQAEITCRQARSLWAADCATLAVRDPDSGAFRVLHHQGVDPDGAISLHALRLFARPDAVAHGRQPPCPHHERKACQTTHCQTTHCQTAIVPLTTPAGWVGSLRLAGLPARLDAQDERNLGVLARQFALHWSLASRTGPIAVQAPAQRAHERQLQRQAAIAALGERALSADRETPDAFFLHALTAATDGLDLGVGAILEYRPSETAFGLRAQLGWSSDPDLRVPAGEDASLPGHVFAHRKAVVVDDWKQESRFRLPQAMQQVGPVSSAALPLWGGKKAYGVLAVHATHHRTFLAEDLQFLQSIASLVGLVLERDLAQLHLRRLDASTEASSDLILVRDPAGRELYRNQSARRIQPADEGCGNQAWFRDVILPAVTRDGLWQCECACVDEAGHPVPIWLVAQAYRRPDGAVEFVTLVGRDLTDRKRMEAQVLQAQKMEVVGRLTSSIAHDFNNILTVISAVCNLVRQEDLPAGLLADDMRELKGAAARATALTRQLLTFSRKQVQTLGDVDVRHVIEGLKPMLLRLAGSHIRTELQICDEPCLVHADVAQLEQIILNLVANARDAMPGGGELNIGVERRHLAVTLLTHDQAIVSGEWVVLSVADNGAGMTESAQLHVFEPFFTTKPEGQGTGLGLSTAYGIIRQSGGAICVDTGPGLGTRLEIYLPALPQDDP